MLKFFKKKKAIKQKKSGFLLTWQLVQLNENDPHQRRK